MNPVPFVSQKAESYAMKPSKKVQIIQKNGSIKIGVGSLILKQPACAMNALMGNFPQK